MKRDLREIINITFTEYNRIGQVWCPILKDYVYFGSEGRIHLIYKGNRKKRPVKEQFYKLDLFPFVPQVIKKSKDIKEVRIISNGVRYYAITSRVGPQKAGIRVIIKKTANGHYNYHSVMLENK